MPESSLTTVETRAVESEQAKAKKQYKHWLKMLERADAFGKIAIEMRCAILYNIHETDTYLQENMSWRDYCDKIQIAKRTSERYLNVARGLIKLCPKAVMLQDKKFIFDASRIEAEFKAMHRSEGDVTLATLAHMGSAANGLRNYFYNEEGQNIRTDEALKLLVDNPSNVPATGESSPSKPTLLPEYLDPFIKAYAAEHKLKWDKLRGWVNSDDSDLSEQQQIDMTLSKEAVACPSEITRMIASECKTLERIIEAKSEFYLNGLKKNSPSVNDAIDNHFKEANTVMERLGACIGELQEGNIKKALWALRSSPEEFFGTEIG